MIRHVPMEEGRDRKGGKKNRKEEKGTWIRGGETGGLGTWINVGEPSGLG